MYLNKSEFAEMAYSVIEGTVLGDMHFAQMTKNATQVLHHYQDYDVAKKSEIAELDKRYCFIAHPERRFRSGWNFIHNMVHRGKQPYRPKEHPNLKCATFEEYRSYTLVHNDDHWQPQSEVIEIDGPECRPTVFLKFDDFGDIWEHLTGVEPVWINHLPDFKGFQWDEELAAKYAADYELWENALSFEDVKALV